MVHRFPFNRLYAILGSAAVLAGCDQTPLALTPQPPAASSVSDEERSACTDPTEEDALLREVIDGINGERMKAGVAPLRVDASLMLVADFYACRLIDGDFFDHVDPFDGTSADGRALDFGYAFSKIGENLAAGQQRPKDVVEDWMASPKHRRNMLDPVFTDIGVAGKDGGEFGRYWVLELGRPLPGGTGPSTSSSSSPQVPQSQPVSQ